MQVLCVGLRRETWADDPSPFSCLPWNQADPVRASVCGQRLPPVARRVIFSRGGHDPLWYVPFNSPLDAVVHYSLRPFSFIDEGHTAL